MLVHFNNPSLKFFFRLFVARAAASNKNQNKNI